MKTNEKRVKTKLWKMIAAISVILSIPAAIIAFIQFFGDESETEVNRHEWTCDDHNDFDDPVFTFTDGNKARVSICASIQVDPKKIIEVANTYGNQDRAVQEMKNAIKGKAYSVLEKYTLEGLRLHRREIAIEIVEACKKDMERTFHNIVSMELGKIVVVK